VAVKNRRRKRQNFSYFSISSSPKTKGAFRCMRKQNTKSRLMSMDKYEEIQFGGMTERKPDRN